MIYFLFGEDTYQIKEEVELIKSRFLEKNKSGAEIVSFEFPETDLERIKNALNSASFLFGKRLVVIKNLITKGGEELKKGFVEYLKTKKEFANESLFIEKGEAQKKDPLFKELYKKSGVKKEFNYFEGRILNDWILKKVKEKSGKISHEAISYFVSSVGKNLWRISNEINKLVNFCGKKEIKKEDVELLVQEKIEPDIFRTIDAIAAKNKKEALFYLHKHLKAGDNEIYLRGMIAYQFRNILKTRALLEKKLTREEIQKRTGIHQYVLGKTLPQVKNFNMETLKSIYNKLLKIDLAVKTSKIEPKIALDLLVVELCK